MTKPKPIFMLGGPLDRLNAMLSWLHPLDRYEAPLRWVVRLGGPILHSAQR